jgi:NAD(P)-dependent dehydrogenase (short-subunit alcohol dehydrogenase family)
MSIKDMMDLQGKVAVVVGGARDLGYDMADALADCGCDLVITSRTRAHAEKAAGKLAASHGCQVLADSLDVCDHSQVAALARRAGDWKGRVDVLINNAGGGLGMVPTNLFERAPEHIEKLISTNLTGPLFCCQEFGRIMVQQRSGSIVNIASIAGLCGRNRRMYDETGLAEQPIEYAAAKAGVIGMTMDLAGLLSPHGVRVNAISPGGFERGQPKAFIDAYNSATPLGRMGTDGVDLKGATVFLASASSAYVTGQNLVVDGGFAIWK